MTGLAEPAMSRDAPAPPSGAQHEIRHGSREAVVAEVGATLRSYRIDGVDVVDGFEVGELSSAGRGQVLAPWPNRLDGGTYSFDGIEGRAALDEPEHGNAIHGLVRWLPWKTVSGSEGEVVLGVDLPPQPAYPWRLRLELAYRLDDDGLTVSATATNRDRRAAPFALGFHPYLTVGTSAVDEAVLSVPARDHLVTDARGLPTGSEPVAGGAFDFTGTREIGATRLDTCFTTLDRGDDGRARVRLSTSDGARSIAVWLDGEFHDVMVYTGDTLDPPERRRRGVAIEPMTSPPNAFRSGIEVIRLEPGRPWRGSWGIAEGDTA
jgi:aldose 1-epimerase